MKSIMQMDFEAWHGFEVCDEMDIQTSVAWDNWKKAWESAMEYAEYKYNECREKYSYIPAHKRPLGDWLKIDDETLNGSGK